MRDLIDVATKLQPPARKFLILPDGEIPHAALRWDSATQKRTRLRVWRREVMRVFAEQARAIKVAWILADLFRLEGYANASNSYIADLTGIAANKVSDTLAVLDQGGAICRVHRIVGENRTQRQIYPARTLTPHCGGMGVHPIAGDGGIPQQVGSQTFSRYRKLPSPLNYARSAAAHRERRTNGEAVQNQDEERR